MNRFYCTNKCPNCDNEHPIEIGYQCGFDAIFDNIKDEFCLNCETTYQFVYDNRINKIVEFKSDEFDSIILRNEFNNRESVIKFFKNLVEIIKVKEK